MLLMQLTRIIHLSETPINFSRTRNKKRYQKGTMWHFCKAECCVYLSVTSLHHLAPKTKWEMSSCDSEVLHRTLAKPRRKIREATTRVVRAKAVAHNDETAQSVWEIAGEIDVNIHAVVNFLAVRQTEELCYAESHNVEIES